MESESVRIMADQESVEAVADRVLAESGGAPAGNGAAAPARAARRGPGRPRKRKRTRSAPRPRPAAPAAAPEPEEPAEQLELSPEERAEMLQHTAATMAPFVHQAVAVLVDRRWPDRPYTLGEAQQLTLALLPVLEKYAGGMLAQYGAETALALVLFAQGNARLGKPAEPAPPPPPPAPAESGAPEPAVDFSSFSRP